MIHLPGLTSSSLLILTLTIIFITGCKDKQATVPEVVNSATDQTNTSQNSTEIEKKTILCFGNSLTAGHGLDESDAWPSLLQKRIDSLELPYLVANAGLSGETTAGGLNRLDWVIKQPVDIFFLELGANDMLRGLDVTKTKENLDQIIMKVHEKYPGIPIILAGMLAPPNMGKDYETAFNALFKDLAEQHGAALIPFFLDKVAGVKELNNPDGLHPNAEGSKIILETVWDVMGPLLR